jgi:hypothetical protein
LHRSLDVTVVVYVVVALLDMLEVADADKVLVSVELTVLDAELTAVEVTLLVTLVLIVDDTDDVPVVL